MIKGSPLRTEAFLTQRCSFSFSSITQARRSAILPLRMTNTSAMDMRITSPVSRVTDPVSSAIRMDRRRAPGAAIRAGSVNECLPWQP
jgi:hypothetical protein